MGADGGGIRGFSSLLILRRLMEYIEEMEVNGYGGAETGADTQWKAADSSYHPHPWEDPATEAGDTCGSSAAGKQTVTITSRYLPCHYFDYVGGTSTGG